MFLPGGSKGIRVDRWDYSTVILASALLHNSLDMNSRSSTVATEGPEILNGRDSAGTLSSMERIRGSIALSIVNTG